MTRAGTGGQQPRTSIVLVHGGFLGAWVWDDVIAALDERGYTAVALDLPSIADRTHDLAGLYDDAHAVRELLDATPAPIILCGHSAGGAVITEAAAGPHPSVRWLTYLTASIPNVGESLADLMADAPNEDPEDADGGAEPVIVRPDGLAELDPEHASDALFNDCAPARATEAVERLRPMSMIGATQPATGAAWHKIPSTLVRGTRDRLPEAITPGFFDEDPEIIEIPTGHCPNWSRPELVANILETTAHRWRDRRA